MEIWAHRGASADAPENTMAAFRLAAEQGADAIEFDVQRTADGELVVIHDETIDRTSTGQGVVAEMTLVELREHSYDAAHGPTAHGVEHGLVGRRLVGRGLVGHGADGSGAAEYRSAGREVDGYGADGCGAAGHGTAEHEAVGHGVSGEPIPTLEEVLAWLPAGLQANVELKTLPTFHPGIATEAADIITASGVADRVWVSSFNHHTLAEVRAHAPRLRLGVLASAHLWRPADYVRSCGAAAYHPVAASLQTPEIVAECHDAGLRVHTWTLDDPEHIRQAEALGVDAVITNRPAAARAATG